MGHRLDEERQAHHPQRPEHLHLRLQPRRLPLHQDRDVARRWRLPRRLHDPRRLPARSPDTERSTRRHPPAVVTDSSYDEYGRVATTYEQHVEDGVPSGTYYYEPEWSVPAVNKITYDLAGRVTETALWASQNDTNLAKKWSTVTVPEGDRTLTTPPAGGTPTTVYTDYQAAPPRSACTTQAPASTARPSLPATRTTARASSPSH